MVNDVATSTLITVMLSLNLKTLSSDRCMRQKSSCSTTFRESSTTPEPQAKIHSRLQRMASIGESMLLAEDRVRAACSHMMCVSSSSGSSSYPVKHLRSFGSG